MSTRLKSKLLHQSKTSRRGSADIGKRIRRLLFGWFVANKSPYLPLNDLNNAKHLRIKDEQQKRSTRFGLVLIAIWLLAWLALWGIHHWGTFGSLVSAQTLTTLSGPVARHPIAPLVVAATYFCSVFVAFPRAALTLPAVLVFGPWLTFFSGMMGLLLAAVCGFWIGQKLTGERLQTFITSPLLRRVEQKLRAGGVGAVVVVRLVPIAPFTVVNMIFGVLRVRIGDFVLGTFLGLLPGFLLSVFVGDRVRNMMRDQSSADLLVLAIQVIAAVVVLYMLWRAASARFNEAER
jgi:uncharacterized membrane protein YdjX (TVP38/TMEM64 family)